MVRFAYVDEHDCYQNTQYKADDVYVVHQAISVILEPGIAPTAAAF